VGESRQDSGGHPTRVSVQEAARVLDISVDAIRKRAARKTLRSEKDESGKVWITLDTEQDTRPDRDQPQSAHEALISEMRAMNAELKEQLAAEREAHREMRRLLAAALERIPPQIEARESPESPGPSPTPTEGSRAPQSGWESLRDEPERTEPRSSTPGTQEGAERPWWRRVFGG
jgi:hypothetical protein